MKIKDTARYLLQEITREWEFEHKAQVYTFREYEGMDGQRMWFNGEEVDDIEEVILDGMTAYDIFEYCSEYELNPSGQSAFNNFSQR